MLVRGNVSLGPGAFVANSLEEIRKTRFMATLDRWRTYLTVPKTLSFPHLELIARDGAPAVVIGTGEVRISSLARAEFMLTGKPKDIGYAFAEICRQQRNPYDDLARFRLVGTDTDGVEWALGWTVPRVNAESDEAWTFCGELEGLCPHDESPSVSPVSGTELIYVVPVNHPMALSMSRFASTDQADGLRRREHVMEVLGSTIRLSYEPAVGALSITASHSLGLPPTFAENWLGEPLRILFGQLVFPRLVARNLGGGKALVFIRPSPGMVRGAGWAALWGDDYPAAAKAEFWNLYSQLLTFIAQARDKDGQPNFEANKVTKLYEEIIQAAPGSRWVWALTFASSIEGLARMLIPKGKKRSDPEMEGIDKLIAHIDAWIGSAFLKGVARSAVHRTAEITTIHTLRDLKAAGVITAEHLSAWASIRNSVMHGSLISPYSSEEEDGKLLALAAMMHALTREILRRSV